MSDDLNVFFAPWKAKASLIVTNPVIMGQRILRPKPPTLLNNALSVYSSGSPLSLTFGGMWFYPNGLGAYYQITDIYGITVHNLATLCSNGMYNSNGMCDIDLQPGCYLFRVDGAFDPDIDDISWQFCGAKGGAQTQLTFCIDNNLQCKGIKVDTASELCADMTSYISTTTLSMAGTFDLGVQSEIASLTDKDLEVIRATLIKG